MAKSRKQQKVAKRAIATVAQTVKESVGDAAKATTKVVQSYIVEPVKHVLTPKKKRPPKKRHVRPPKQSAAAAPSPLLRGRSSAARTMSAGIAKSIAGPAAAGSTGGIRSLAPSQSPLTGSAGSEPTSTRSIRRQAKRRTMES